MEKKRYYYNGNLVRTSTTHEYKYGVLNVYGAVISCHGTKEAAEKAKNAAAARIKKYNDVKYMKKHTELYTEQQVKDEEKRIEEYVKKLEVVELEQR